MKIGWTWRVIETRHRILSKSDTISRVRSVQGVHGCTAKGSAKGSSCENTPGEKNLDAANDYEQNDLLDIEKSTHT